MGKPNDFKILVTPSETPDFASHNSTWWDYKIIDRVTKKVLKFGKRSGRKTGVKNYCLSLLKYCKENSQWQRANQRRKYNTTHYPQRKRKN